MVMDYFDMRGDWTEESLAGLRENHEDLHIGTCLDQVIDMFEAVGVTIDSCGIVRSVYASNEVECITDIS